MRRLATMGAALMLLVACGQSSLRPDIELASSERAPASLCGRSGHCEVLEGQVARVDAALGHLVVTVDLAWADGLRTGLGDTHFQISDVTLFLPTQIGLAALEPGEDVMVRSTPEAPEGRHALSVVRVDRD